MIRLKIECYICGQPAMRAKKMPNGKEKPVCVDCWWAETKADNGNQPGTRAIERMMTGRKNQTKRVGGKWKRS